MYKNPIWLALLTLFVFVAICFSGNTGYMLYQYKVKTTPSTPKTIHWNVESKASDRYVVSAKYSFLFDDKEWEGNTIFDAKGFKNILAADHAIETFSKKKWTVWFSPKNPKNSTINLFFPLKSCIYTAILWGILLYFVWLGIYVKKFK